MTTSTLTSERADLLEALATHRFHLTHTVQDLTDDQARLRPTVSQLSLGGLVKHVAATERGWIDFVLRGASAFPAPDEELWAARELEFTLLPDETLEGVLAVYAEVAARTDELVRTLPSLGRRAPAARGAVVRAGRLVVGPAGAGARRRRDRPARRPRRHPAGDDRRPEVHGLTR